MVVRLDQSWCPRSGRFIADFHGHWLPLRSDVEPNNRRGSKCVVGVWVGGSTTEANAGNVYYSGSLVIR